MEKVIFLGTSAGMPSAIRNVASLALIFENKNDFWLFDCGEGTQHQIQRIGLKLSKLKNIFISHLHGDHIFGLPGLLATRGLQGIEKSINIFGPVGLEEYLRSCFYYSKTYIPYHYNFYPIEREKFMSSNLLWKKEDCSVYCAILNHQIDSFGYSVIEKKTKRNIIVEKLTKLGIQPGPIYQDIKEKREITLKNGRILKTDDFVKESIKIKKISYCSDTMFSENAINLSRDADLLIHEATFASKEKIEAKQSFHSTIKDALKVARSANVKKLVLTHISPRYHHISKDFGNWNTFQEEVQSQQPEIILAEDFLKIEI